MSKKITRREFLKGTAAGTVALASAACLPTELFPAPHIKNRKIANKVIVLGFDGMDPVLVQRFVAEGRLPTFKKLIERGYMGNLATTLPPQSPVAWSSFISGTNPGGHGIYDFIHRDAAQFAPYLSTSRSHKTEKTWDVGRWSIPVKGGRVELMRRGPVFWDILADHDVGSTISQLPANFPVDQSGTARQLSGMGTPDILGSYGTFTLFSEEDVPGAESFTGGRVVKIKAVDHVVKSVLAGPKNELNSKQDSAEIEFTIHRDPWERAARINMQGQELLLHQGEWSEWIPLKFELMPMFVAVSGMVRIYLQQVHPYLRVYMSPINIDPMNPYLPICNPSSYSKELSDVVGRFYTQGFPEDTKALSHGVFNNREYLAQANIVLDERQRAFEHEFADFKEGFFLFYFSSIDQNSHMLWSQMHPGHPHYDPNEAKEVKDALAVHYSVMDKVLAQTLDKVDNYTDLFVLSDHGFAPFTREFHVSTWLVENGYMALTQPDKIHESEFYRYVDWSKTKAYVMGINGIYLNLQGRERRGSVNPREALSIKREIMAKLEKVQDPDNGRPVIKRAYDADQVYSGPFMDLAPDIVLGYHSGYRISDEAVLGKFPKGLVGDRKDRWAADHCMDPSEVPGVLLSNRKVVAPNPGLWDLAPTILKSFGIATPKEMDGKPILEA